MSDEPKKLTPASMRAWEDRIGPEKVQEAFAILRSHGWKPDDAPPVWVYAQAYLMVEGRIPKVWGDKTPSLREQLFGGRLF